MSLYSLLFPNTMLKNAHYDLFLPWFSSLFLLSSDFLNFKLRVSFKDDGFIKQLPHRVSFETNSSMKSRYQFFSQWEEWLKNNIEYKNFAIFEKYIENGSNLEMVSEIIANIKGNVSKKENDYQRELYIIFFLFLAHVYDYREEDVESELDILNISQKKLLKNFDYHQNRLDYDIHDKKVFFNDTLNYYSQKFLKKRLVAWATLAATLDFGKKEVWLSALSPLVVKLVQEKYIDLLKYYKKEYFCLTDKFWKEKTIRISIPVFSIINESDFSRFNKFLFENNVKLRNIQEELSGLLNKIASNGWSSDLYDSILNSSLKISEKIFRIFDSLNIKKEIREILIFVFPALNFIRMVKLMKGIQSKVSNFDIFGVWSKDMSKYSYPIITFK